MSNIRATEVPHSTLSLFEVQKTSAVDFYSKDSASVEPSVLGIQGPGVGSQPTLYSRTAWHGDGGSSIELGREHLFTLSYGFLGETSRGISDEHWQFTYLFSCIVLGMDTVATAGSQQSCSTNPGGTRE